MQPLEWRDYTGPLLNILLELCGSSFRNPLSYSLEFGSERMPNDTVP